MKYIKATIYRFGYPIAKVCWFITRPTTQGVRCLVVYEDEILLIKHTYGSRLLSTVGGGLKKGETLEAAAIRETWEEVGLELNKLQKIAELDYREEYKKDRIHVFLADASSKNLTVDCAEIQEAGWYKLDRIPTDTSPLFEHFLELARPYLHKH